MGGGREGDCPVGLDEVQAIAKRRNWSALAIHLSQAAVILDWENRLAGLLRA